MKRFPLCSAVVLAISVPFESGAIPQSFGGGGFFGADAAPPRVLDEDWTDELVAVALWGGGGGLPGDWSEVPSVEGEEVRRWEIAPRVFGAHPRAVFATLEEGALRSISLLYLDAGDHYGYRPGEADLRELQRSFKARYKELEETLEDALAERAERRGQRTAVGRTAFLRSEYLDYPLGDLTLRYSAVEGQGVSVTVLRTDDLRGDYLDASIATLDTKERRERCLSRVERGAGGDVVLTGVPAFRQGQRPYCAVGTLGMATHYLGLRMGTDALAAGARFRGTGSAKGAKVLELYMAAAKEVDAGLQRSGRFDFDRAQRALDKGFPVVVWRRYSRERDLLHAAAAGGAPLPRADEADRASWPTGEDAPGHASVVTGFNAETGEVIFAESWGEHAQGKRMRAEELEATSYAAFYFKL